MACTSQSALKYVENARPHLVGELRNLSVILENLYQQKVLIDEEVSKINAERDDYDRTRAILDSVTRKGDAACYVFLRIIDQTRRRTLERQTPLSKSSHEASTEGTEFDLHHWISCFPFKEDAEIQQNYIRGPRPCCKYQKKLKSKAKKLSENFWRASKDLFAEDKKPDLFHSAVVFDIQGKISPSKIKKIKNNKSKKSRPKKLRTYIPGNKPEISPSDLLKTDKNILLVGKPGIGKSALSHEILRLWSERDNKELDYMFYFDMRKLTNIPPIRSLEDLLFTACSEPDEGKDEVLQDIKSNSDNVTVILDGVTDLSPSVVEKLVDKDFLPDAKIIITCRPEDEENLSLEDWLRVEVKGFCEETIKTYLSSTLGENHRKVLSNVELLTLCHVPMYALMVAASFSSTDSLQPRTVTEIYINIVRFGLQMNSNKTRIRNLSQFIKTKRNGILSLAEAAFNATERKTVNLGELSCEDTCVLSFLKTLHGKVPPTETITLNAFLHYTMQEFFAALWLLKNPDKISEVLQQCLTEEKKHMKHLIPFMCRLLNEKSPCLMSCLIPAEEIKETSGWFFKEMIDIFFSKNEDTERYVDILFLCQCLYESQSSENCISFLENLDFHLDLSGENLDPYSCCAVAFMVTQSKERKISLNLQDVTVSEQGMRHLFGCIENVQWVDPLPLQLWTVVFLSEGLTEYMTLLHRCGNQLYLPVVGEKLLFERAVKVMQRSATKVNVCLHWTQRGHVCQSLCESLLQVLPYTHHLRFDRQSSYRDEQTRFLVNLFCAAAEREQQTGEKMLDTLTSVCRYQTILGDNNKYQSDFLLDLYSQMKDRETKSGLSLLPSLQSVFQSAPEVWTIKLSERKTSILLEVMKLQPEKKPVKLTDCSHGESEVRSFLQCLPFISHLSVPPGFFQSVCSSLSVRSREEIQQLVSLLHLLTFNLQLTGVLPRKTCSSVGKVLPLCASIVDLILTDSRMSARGAALLFRSTTQLHSLRLSNSLVLFLSQWVRRGRVTSPLVLEELSVVSTKAQPQRVLLKVGSSLASLLRFWTVGRLDLTESGLPAQSLFSLLLHDAPLRLRLREEKLQQLLGVLHEVQDQNLTLSLLNKVGGDLSSCRLSWELLHFLLQQPTAQIITVNLRKNRFLEERAAQLLLFLHRLLILRLSPSFVRTSIREIFRTHPSNTIPWLLRSLDHVINLNCTELDSRDCDALLFILRYSDRKLRLKLVWSSIPAEGIQSILYMLHTVSDLSVDRNVLLRFLHCCAASDSLQGAASGLLRTLKHRLDLSCSSCVELPEEEDQTEPLRLTAADCRAVSTVLSLSSGGDTQLDLRDCEVEDSGLDLLFPVLDRVPLRVNKTVLVQLLSLLAVNNQRDTARRAASLCRALGGEVDLSHCPLDQRLCGAVALLLDYCEDVRELDLSHCQLTDQLLLQLSAHLHKVHILDLSHNLITDLSIDSLLHMFFLNPFIHSVRLNNNNIMNKSPFKGNKMFDIW